MAQLMDWAKAGTLSVHIYAKYPLEDYRKAFEAIAKRQTLGKTLFRFAAAGAD
jgi:NADPH:quinone reductase-like Zn-dependent oxidoreductase